MKWLVDECVAFRLVAHLRAAGHDVSYAAEQFSSTDDIDLLERALKERRLLLTEDKDFGELIFGMRARESAGVIMLRIPDDIAYLAWPRLQAAISRFAERLFGAFTVVEETRFRTRPIGDR